MSETTGTPALNEALAKFQAALPRVGKGEKADVPGKEGKRGYSYKYADLADVSQAALPLLGSFGLAFTAKPTYHILGERLEFVLHYKLTHSSGEYDEGFYPLPDPARTDAQKVGSAITYARRYSQLAVTGIHPDGEDDDGATAQDASYSAGDAWENAAPARPANGGQRGVQANGSGRPQGQVSRPAPGKPAPAAETGEPDPDAQCYADEAHEARTLTVLRDIQTRAREAHKLAALIRNPATGNVGGLGQLIEYHRKRLTEIDTALRALNEAAGAMPIDELETHVRKVTGAGIEDASAAQLRQAAEVLKVGAAA